MTHLRTNISLLLAFALPILAMASLSPRVRHRRLPGVPPISRLVAAVGEDASAQVLDVESPTSVRPISNRATIDYHMNLLCIRVETKDTVLDPLESYADVFFLSFGEFELAGVLLKPGCNYKKLMKSGLYQLAMRTFGPSRFLTFWIVHVGESIFGRSSVMAPEAGEEERLPAAAVSGDCRVEFFALNDAKLPAS